MIRNARQRGMKNEDMNGVILQKCWKEPRRDDLQGLWIENE